MKATISVRRNIDYKVRAGLGVAALLALVGSLSVFLDSL